jgi:hypothetical protein
MKLQGATDDHQIWIGKESALRLPRLRQRATAHLQVFAEEFAGGIAELRAETEHEIDADASMVGAFPGHRIHSPIKVLMALLGQALVS